MLSEVSLHIYIHTLLEDGQGNVQTGAAESFTICLVKEFVTKVKRISKSCFNESVKGSDESVESAVT